eukprot:362187-Pleurochrysis_carterae.AAC.3
MLARTTVQLARAAQTRRDGAQSGGVASIHPGQIPLGCGVDVTDRLWVVASNDTPARALHVDGRLPRLVHVLVWELGQHGQPLAHVLTYSVVLSREVGGRVDAMVRVEEACGAQPHPVGRVDSPVSINQQFVENVAPSFPVDPELSAREEARDDVPEQVM